MIAPAHRHFAKNAAGMLRRGESSEYVANSLRQMGFDSGQVQELLALAQQMAQEKVPTFSIQSADFLPSDIVKEMAPARLSAKRWWQFWR